LNRTHLSTFRAGNSIYGAVRNNYFIIVILKPAQGKRTNDGYLHSQNHTSDGS
jgi:hypothetical protein